MSKFKVGQKVRHKESGVIDEVISFPGMKEYDSYKFSFPEQGFLLKKVWDFQKYWEGIEEVESVCTGDEIEPLRLGMSMPEFISRHGSGVVYDGTHACRTTPNLDSTGIYYWDTTENKFNNKPKKTIMESVVKFAKDLTLSADEKALRQAGLKNEDGVWTIESKKIIYNLVAKSRGYKTAKEMGDEFNHDGAMYSVFELQSFFVKFGKELLDIAKKYNKENK